MLKVDIGCGESKPPGYIGVDIYSGPGVDIVADISKVFPFHTSTVDVLRAHDVIEHLPDRINTMNEIWRVCKPGARVDLRVPSSDGRGAFQDPTHISFWNANSFFYYSVDFPPYYHLCQRYGFRGAFKILRLQERDSGGGVIHVDVELEVIKPVPGGGMTPAEPQAIARPATPALVITPAEWVGIALSAGLETTLPLLTKLQQHVDGQQLGQYFQDSTAETQNSLRQLRIILARYLLTRTPDQLQQDYAQALGTLHHQLVHSPLTLLPRSDEDQSIASAALAALKDENQAEWLQQHLLVAMLYFPAHQLPPITEIPEYRLRQHLSYVFATPPLFCELGESDRYYHHLHFWIDYLHQKILSQPSHPFWQNAATSFNLTTSFLQIYFNEANLRELCQKRAEILEFSLRQLGHTLDYEFPQRPESRRKIRLGILAAHFLPTAETAALLPVYEHLNRNFEVILYTLNPAQHPLVDYCRSCANDLRHLTGDLKTQVDTIRADDLDLIWIGTNITGHANPICLLSAHRLARIQLTSVASVITTGLRHMDYYVSGTLTDAEDHAQQHYSEQLLRLPGTAQCFSYPLPVPSSSLQVDRARLGIAPEKTVFVSAANFFKLTPELLHTWARIIAAVPNALLLLFPFGPNWSSQYPKSLFAHQVMEIFAQHGLSKAHVVICDPQPAPDREGLKAFLKLGDVYLDSYPFAGTTSLVDPLELGLPAIARRGRCFRSAMGAAILESLALPELVGRSEEEYVQGAIALGSDAKLRQEMGDRVRQAMQSNPTFLDSPRYSAQVGDLLQGLFEDYQKRTPSVAAG